MPAIADTAGRIRCQACGHTLLWLKAGIVHWTFRVRPGAWRTIGVAADSPALNDLLVVCECGTRWTPSPLTEPGLVPAPELASVLKPVQL